MKILHPDHDTHWKELIEKLFWNTLAFFLPKIYAIADQSKGVEFLDKELHKLIADKFKKGNTRKDKLAKIYLKNGKEHYVLIHFEVQTKFEKGFLKRMFVYFYRIFDKRAENITALVIYTGDYVPPGHNRFEYEFMGTELVYKFNTYLVCDADEAALLADDNPVALAVLAAKYLNKTESTEDLRRQYKMKLIRLTRGRGWERKEISAILQFINLMIILSDKQEIKFVDDVKTELLEMKKDTVPPHIKKHREFLESLSDVTLPIAIELVTPRITEEITEKVTEEITEKVTEKVTEEITEKVTEEVTEKVREEMAEKIRENKLKVTRQLLTVSDLSAKQIAEIQELPLDVVLRLKEEIS